MARYRSYNEVGPNGGSATPMPGYEYLGDVHQGSFAGPWGTCVDVTDHQGEVNPFFLEKKYDSFGSYNGQDGTYYRADQWLSRAEVTGFSPCPEPPDTNTIMTHTLAKTAPYVADWSAANAVYELKDFRHYPSIIKELGERELHYKQNRSRPFQTGSNIYLSWTFGIAPLISDVQKCLKFMARMNSRVDDFNNFSRPGGASKNATIFSAEGPETYQDTSYCTGLYGAGATYRRYLQTSRKVWGSVNWVIPKANLPPRASPAYLLLASSLANGYQVSPDTIWQGLPWSWMIDWFGNIDDFIKLSYNTVGATSGRYCVMDKRTVRVTTRSDSPGYSSGPPGAYISKRRTPTPFVYPEVRLPLISDGMAAILGSLAIQRAPKIRAS